MSARARQRAASGDAQAFLTKAMCWKRDECLLWPYTRNQTGIPMISLREGNKRPNKSVRKLVCESAYGSAPAKHKAYVRCGNALCVAPRHLEWKDASKEAAEFLGGFAREDRSRWVKAARAAEDPEHLRKRLGAARACITEAGKARSAAAARDRMMALSPEERRERSRKAREAAKVPLSDPEVRRKAGESLKRTLAAMSDEERQARTKRLTEARMAALTPARRQEIASLAAAHLSQEQRVRAGLRSFEVRPKHERARRAAIMLAARWGKPRPEGQP